MIEIPSSHAQRNDQQSRGNSIAALFNRDLRIGGRKFGDQRKERFYSELATLLTSGIDLRTAIELLAGEAERETEKKLYAAVLEAIIHGSTLPDALNASGYFSAYEFYSLRIGEETGRMTEVLNDLARFYSKKIKQKRKITGALTYPLVVISVAIGAVVFMLRFVVPMFADMLARFGTGLPSLTKMVIAASNVLAEYGVWILLVLLLAGVFTWRQRKTEWFRKWSSRIVLRIPFVGQLTRKIYIERFAQAMHLLLVSKTNLPEALDLVKRMITFYPLEQSLQQIREDVVHGASLNESLARHPIYPKRLVSLIRVAEEVNQTDAMFARLSEQLSAEIDHETALIGSIVEPVMIVLLGILVAVILVAMYLPMFQLGSTL